MTQGERIVRLRPLVARGVSCAAKAAVPSRRREPGGRFSTNLTRVFVPEDRLTIASVSADRQAEALALLFADAGAEARRLEVRRLLERDAEAAEFLTAAYDGRGLAAVAWAQPLGVDAALVSTPRFRDSSVQGATAASLLNALEHRLRARNRRFLQAMVAESADGEIFLHAGFQRLTRLIYLVLDQAALATAAAGASESGLEMISLADQHGANRERLEKRIVRVVEQTYQETLDCPELNDVRSAVETVAGYRTSGEYDARLWRLAVCAGEDAGCAILTRHGEHDVELLYYGATPAVRGRGLGRRILGHAAAAAVEVGAVRLVTAVDLRNRPAIAQYSQHQFSAWAHREAYIKKLDR